MHVPENSAHPWGDSGWILGKRQEAGGGTNDAIQPAKKIMQKYAIDCDNM